MEYLHCMSISKNKDVSVYIESKHVNVSTLSNIYDIFHYPQIGMLAFNLGLHPISDSPRPV